MSLYQKKYFLEEKEEVVCNRCKKNYRRSYHSWCASCYNEYINKRILIDRELGKGDYIYFIVNTKTGIICYTGKSNSIVIRKKAHLDWQTSKFGKMLRAANSNSDDYKMFLLDLTSFNLTGAELRAIEHQHNRLHIETVVNSDIVVTEKDAYLLEELKYKGILDEIDKLEWIEYDEFLHKKNTINSHNDSI